MGTDMCQDNDSEAQGLERSRKDDVERAWYGDCAVVVEWE